MDIPKNLGKYEVLSPIAKGSMGMVYRGHDPIINRSVALKVALPEILNHRESGERYRKLFFNEALTAGKLNHPNILDIYDAGVESEMCFIAMELVEGVETVKTHTRSDNLLVWDKVASIVYHCALALDYAHRQGVIHRDIKPSNLLLTQSLEVKLADFSIAYVNGVEEGSLATGFVGSPRYMSPEQIQDEPINQQTDIFSLGVVLYELLCGKHPYGGDSFSTLVYRIVNEEHTPIREYKPDAPDLLESIIGKCLDKDLRRRYKSGLELAADMSRAFPHLPSPQVLPTQADKFKEIAQIEFFREFSEQELAEVLRAGVWLEFQQGDQIITEGELDDTFFVIMRGSVSVKKSQITVDTLSAGDCFGEMSYINKARRTAAVHANGQVALLKYNAGFLEQLSKDSQLRFCKVLLRTLIRRLSITTTRMVSGMQGGAR